MAQSGMTSNSPRAAMRISVVDCTPAPRLMTRKSGVRASVMPPPSPRCPAQLPCHTAGTSSGHPCRPAATHNGTCCKRVRRLREQKSFGRLVHCRIFPSRRQGCKQQRSLLPLPSTAAVPALAVLSACSCPPSPRTQSGDRGSNPSHPACRLAHKCRRPTAFLPCTLVVRSAILGSGLSRSLRLSQKRHLTSESFVPPCALLAPQGGCYARHPATHQLPAWPRQARTRGVLAL